LTLKVLFFEDLTGHQLPRKSELPLQHIPASEELFKSGLLINTPVQARSNARVTALLDAAAKVVHDKGYEDLTTANVAEAAGASIGTVYRYFEDRVKVLEALAIRNLERTDRRFRDALEQVKGSAPNDAIDVMFEMYLDMFRTEPGFRSLRLGDVLDIRPRNRESRLTTAARTMTEQLSLRFGFANDAATVLEIEKSLVAVDAYLARAFFNDDRGDAVFIDAARASVMSLSSIAH
jgi:AcrR family transcriptional regulator